MGYCGTIFEDGRGRTCSCEIETPEIDAAEASERMSMVFPFPQRHDGPHRGRPIDTGDDE